MNRLAAKLSTAFPDAKITVEGDSSVLDGAAAVVRVVSCSFDGVSKVKRHQLVYKHIGDCIASGELHALTIVALTPQEEAASAA